MSLQRHARLAAAVCAGAALASSATAQSRYFFSVNWHGPTVGTPDPASTVPMTEGDILRPFNATSLPILAPATPPNISYTHTAGGLGLPGGCIGHPGGTPCIVEVDAMSRGGDHPFQDGVEIRPGQILFSVDEFARGIPGGGPGPNVATESMAREAAPDGFTNLMPLPPGPVPVILASNVGVIDGDGLPSASGFAYPGTGIVEPNTPFGGLPDTGDNKDAMDLVQPTPSIPGPYWFSLDSSFIDPLEGVPNSGSALANGFVGGDVLIATAAGPAVWAPAPLLGLDLLGTDTDDLDALILFENGTGAFEPSSAPYDWTTGSTDMLVFSVRRGSAVIGMPDSMFGIPIEEGDLLVPPIAGGASPFPGIFVSAESLGLGTVRAGFGNFGDDLTAADSLRGTMYDCDGDNIEDAVAIAQGLVPDTNMNGIPDSCEGCPPVGTPFCFCTQPIAPCGNPDPSAGCVNVAGTGALLTGCGSSSVGADDLILTTSGMVPATFALTFMGPGGMAPVNVGNGLLCVSGPLYRFPPYATGAGTASTGPGLVAFTIANNPPAGQITIGSTWAFQTYYRDIGGACGSFFNLSNALRVTFTP